MQIVLEVDVAPLQFVEWLRSPVYKMFYAEFQAQHGGHYKLYQTMGSESTARYFHPQRPENLVPLDLEICCEYSPPAESISVEDKFAALRVRVWDKSGKTAIRLDWRIPEIDHVAHLLRVIAQEWDEVRVQIVEDAALMTAIEEKSSPEIGRAHV